MDKLVEAATEGALWGIAFGAAIAVLRPARKAIRPAVRSVVKGGVSAGHIVSDATRKGRNALSDLYSEAEADRSKQHASSNNETAAHEPA